jgi:hypothetical protein
LDELALAKQSNKDDLKGAEGARDEKSSDANKNTSSSHAGDLNAKEGEGQKNEAKQKSSASEFKNEMEEIYKKKAQKREAKLQKNNKRKT